MGKFKAKFRRGGFWKAFVVVTLPVFHWTWKHVFNFRERRLYLRSRIPKRKDSSLLEEGIRIVRDDPEFARFANHLRDRIGTPLLKQQELDLKASTHEEGYSGELVPRLSVDLKLELLRFALSDKLLENVLPYFGILPKLNSIGVFQNVPRSGERPAGSMLWHRDSDNYRALNLFMCVNEVDDETGPYHAISARGIPFAAMIPFVFESETSAWKRCRVPDHVIDEYVSRKYWYKLAGKPGTAAFVDPGSLYHKGGYCTKKSRLMLQISYATNTPNPIKNIIKALGLEGHPGLDAVLDTPEKRFMVRGDNEGLLWRLGIKNPTHRIGKGILHYDMRKDSALAATGATKTTDPTWADRTSALQNTSTEAG